jgi:hypothetical protein
MIGDVEISNIFLVCEEETGWQIDGFGAVVDNFTGGRSAIEADRQSISSKPVGHQVVGSGSAVGRHLQI